MLHRPNSLFLHNEPNEITLRVFFLFTSCRELLVSLRTNVRMMFSCHKGVRQQWSSLGLFPLDDIRITGSSITSSSKHHVGFPSSETV